MLPFIGSGQNHLVRHSERGKQTRWKQNKQTSKRWEDNTKEWASLEFARSQRAVESGKNMETSGCEVICGAPTTQVVKGWVKLKVVEEGGMLRSVKQLTTEA